MVNIAIKAAKIKDTEKSKGFFVFLRNHRFQRDFLAINGLENFLRNKKGDCNCKCSH
jgi:hypothetical protein